jgi:hypothetical protein
VRGGATRETTRERSHTQRTRTPRAPPALDLGGWVCQAAGEESRAWAVAPRARGRGAVRLARVCIGPESLVPARGRGGAVRGRTSSFRMPRSATRSASVSISRSPRLHQLVPVAVTKPAWRRARAPSATRPAPFPSQLLTFLPPLAPNIAGRPDQLAPRPPSSHRGKLQASFEGGQHGGR